MCPMALCVRAVALAMYINAWSYYLSLPMAVKQTIPYNDGIYFITFTCYKWMPLVELTDSYDLVYNWFDYIKSKGHFITGYIIMPNHVHSLIGLKNTGKSINKIVDDGKRFIAYEIVTRLHTQSAFAILERQSAAVEPPDRLRGKKHEVWEDSFDWKDCRSHFFTDQKLNFMHNNPCNAKWNLAPVENNVFGYFDGTVFIARHKYAKLQSQTAYFRQGRGYYQQQFQPTEFISFCS